LDLFVDLATDTKDLAVIVLVRERAREKAVRLFSIEDTREFVYDVTCLSRSVRNVGS
jgi:hypothetical protein